MLVDMNEQGQIVLTPESYAESIALRFWNEANTVHVEDVLRATQTHFKPTAFHIEDFK